MDSEIQQYGILNNKIMIYVDIRKLLDIDRFISRKCTGKAQEFAKKVGISRSSLFEYLEYMRQELRVEIVYNRYSETYYYDGKCLREVLGGSFCKSCPYRKNGSP